MTTKKLSDRQQVFINEYLRCWNATKAATNAGYSPKTAYSIGSENLKKPEIRAEIDARLAEMAMTANEALTRLSEHARADMSDFLDIDGNIDIDKAERAGKLHLVKRLSRTKDGLTIELHDSQSALVRILNELHLLEGGATSRIEMNVRNLPPLPEDTLDDILTD